MKTEAIWAPPGHRTGHHEFGIFGDASEFPPLLAVQAGVPITEAMAVAESIFECVAEFEYERQRGVSHSPITEWASRWLLTIAEALVVSVRKGHAGQELPPR